MTPRRTFLGRLLTGTLLATMTTTLTLARSAEAQEVPSGGPLVLAMYAPSAPLPSADARFAYLEKIAQKLQSAGIPTQGKVFAKAADLESAVKKGQVDLAILDPLYMADRGGGYNILAVATSSGDVFLRWGLYTHLPTGNILDMANKRLAWVAPSGKEPTYIGNVMLYGELRATYFQLRPAAPDMSAAVSDVVLRRADCVFAPEAAVAGKQLRKAYDAGEAGRIPNPALVQISTRMSSETLANIKKTLAGFNTTGVLDGWRTGGSVSDTFRSLRSRLRGRADRNLVMAEPQRLSTQVNSAMIQSMELTPQQPGLRVLIIPPEGIP
jgi:hypothetical protein